MKEQLRQALQEALTHLGPAGGSVTIHFESPPREEFGDLSSPLCLTLAKVWHRPPMSLAQELTEALRPGLGTGFLRHVQEVTAAPPGYVNFRLRADSLAAAVLAEVAASGSLYGRVRTEPGDGAHKVVIEHTNINPNKAAHIGHLRNACLGDLLARLYRARGYRVEVQNYIDDTGVQVADIVVGLERLGRQPDGDVPFDYFCWDLYTEVQALYERDPEAKAYQREVLARIEEGDNETARTARQVAERIVGEHLRTMWPLGIYYDLLTWESHILGAGFWQHAFRKLQAQGSLAKEETGPNAGCWVVKLSDLPEFANLENPDKILVRSNGTATYTAKDLAYQMWKFGLLGKDFRYSPYTIQPNGQALWTSAGEEGEERAGFGKADRVINVIDVRQKYLQDVLRFSLQRLGFTEAARNSIHFAYEVVALSPKAARELGLNVADEGGAVAMSGRKGVGVKAKDLIQAARRLAWREVAARHPEMDNEQQDEIAAAISTGAIRYYMVRFHPNSLIAFDFDEALSMQGNSGPYLQYAHARACSILARARERLAAPADASQTSGPHTPVRSGGTSPAVPIQVGPAEKRLLLKMMEMPTAVERAAELYLPNLFADYAYGLAQAFTEFYETTPVLGAEESLRDFRLQLVDGFRQVMAGVLDILGIPAPAVM
ncbi:MAG TPA: arginine--tRNA ligase [Firmicutes bacterium]|nr:arginine--tRNA ligase [Bacillota bacterium]